MKAHLFFLLSVAIMGLSPALAQSRFSAGITVAPVLDHNHSNYTFMVPTQTGQVVSTTFDQRLNRGGFTLGLSVEYALTARWSVSLGFGLNQLLNTENNPFIPIATPTRVRTSSWQIPLLINYRTSLRRLSPYFSAGVLGYKYTGTRFKSTRLPATRVEFEIPFRVQPMIGAGVAYRLTSRWLLTAQPVLIWQFQPKSADYIRYDQFVSYQLQAQVRLLHTF